MDYYLELVDKAENRTRKLLKNHYRDNHNFWNENFDRFYNTAEGYIWLLKKFREEGVVGDFEGKYFVFYYMRFVSPNFRERYFRKMKEMQVDLNEQYSLKKLALELKDGDSIMFSFVTKLLNLYDGKFTLYDSHVNYAMGLGYGKFKYVDNKLSQYLECHKAIHEVYQRIAVDCKEIIKDFRKYISNLIPDEKCLSDEWKLRHFHNLSHRKTDRPCGKHGLFVFCDKGCRRPPITDTFRPMLFLCLYAKRLVVRRLNIKFREYKYKF